MLFARIREVVATGTSVIYITHRLAELRQIAHRVTVLRDGKLQGGGAGRGGDRRRSLAHDRRPGAGLDLSAQGDERRRGGQFSVRALSGQNFRDVSFDVGRGEIIGIAGVAGNGQTELMRALAGLQPLQGEVFLDGQSLSHPSCCTRPPSCRPTVMPKAWPAT